MTNERRLYGLRYAENLYTSIADVYESSIEGGYPTGTKIEIEEWTVADNRTFFPSVSTVIEQISEGYLVDSETNEDWWENAANRSTDPDVIAAFEAAIALWASKVTYMMAGEKVKSHWVFITGGNPLVNDIPLYQGQVLKVIAVTRDAQQIETTRGGDIGPADLHRSWIPGTTTVSLVLEDGTTIPWSPSSPIPSKVKLVDDEYIPFLGSE